MEKQIKLLLIDYDSDSIEKIIQSIEEYRQKENGCRIFTEYLPGSKIKKSNRNTYCLYDESIISEINDEILKNGREYNIGILLEIVLSERELLSQRYDDYPHVILSKTIFEEFHVKVPIYIITSLPNFYAHSESIMGRDLSRQFIPKEILTRFKMRAAMKDMEEYFEKWYQRKGQENEVIKKEKGKIETEITGRCLLEKICKHYGCNKKKILELMPELHNEYPVTDIQNYTLDTISSIHAAIKEACEKDEIRNKSSADKIRQDISVMMRRVYASHLEGCNWTIEEFGNAIKVITKYTDWLYFSQTV